jgi:DNA-binding NarL/FixJ family response regulator
MTAEDLTPEQRSILEQLLAGKTTSEMARDQHVPASTMGFRVMNIKHALGLRTLLQLGAWCERHGIRESSPT